MKLSAITCTGGRPDAWALCQRWMERQTRQPDEWVVVDDCIPHSDDPRLRSVIIRPTPVWSPRHNTLTRNLRIGLETATGDALVIIEDDDWYAPTYLEHVERRLEDTNLTGETCCRYYHVGTRLYREMVNSHHASLFQSAFTRVALPSVLKIVRSSNSAFVDLQIWRDIKGDLEARTGLTVGIKGLPGRPGIGNGHRASCKTPDPDGSILRSWIGNDADHYLKYGVRS